MPDPISYVDTDELASQLHIQSGEQRSADLQEIVDSASRQVDDHCQRYFGQVGTVDEPVARMFPTSNGLVMFDGRLDLVSCSLVEYETGTSWADYDASLLILQPANAATEAPARPYEWASARSGVVLPGRLRFTGVWGWPEKPPWQVVRATRLQCFRLFKSPEVATGVVGGADNMGVLRLSASLHPDAKALLDSFVKVSIGG